MAIQDNQIVHPFTASDKAKLDTIDPGAEAQLPIADQAQAEAGTDNMTSMTPLRVKQAIDASAVGGSPYKYYTNDSGQSLNGFTPVKQTAAGNIEPVNASVEADVINLFGVLLQATANNDLGPVGLLGLIPEVITAFSVGDILYLSKTAALTTTVPDIGVIGFAAGDFVVKIGRITKNTSDITKKDFLIEIEIMGQL